LPASPREVSFIIRWAILIKDPELLLRVAGKFAETIARQGPQAILSLRQRAASSQQRKDQDEVLRSQAHAPRRIKTASTAEVSFGQRA